jgi:anti-sigma factor RsiW
MTCQEVADFLLAYLAGELDAPVVAELERHLALCRACRDYLATYWATVELGRQAFGDLQADARGAVPDELVVAILESCRR